MDPLGYQISGLAALLVGDDCLSRGSVGQAEMLQRFGSSSVRGWPTAYSFGCPPAIAPRISACSSQVIENKHTLGKRNQFSGQTEIPHILGAISGAQHPL